MSYTVPCLVVQRTAQNQENLVGTGRFLSKHDRLGTVSGCWKLDVDRARSCSFLLIATNGQIVDVARILDAEVVPKRWTTVTAEEETAGLKPIDKKRVLLVTSPTVPEKIVGLIGQQVQTSRNPVRYVAVAVNGSATISSEEGEVDEDDGEVVQLSEDARFDRYADAAEGILIATSLGSDTITYGSLAERVLEETGIPERRPLHWWIGQILAIVAKRNHDRSQPFLSSLVVRASDGKVGDGYLIPLRQLRGEEPEDAEEHAAIERVRCYRSFATTKADAVTQQ